MVKVNTFYIITHYIGQLFLIKINHKQVEILIKHEDWLKHIGNRLRELRKNQKLSYPETARRIGISKTTLYEIERGEINFQIEKLLMILDFFQVPPEKFFQEC